MSRSSNTSDVSVVQENFPMYEDFVIMASHMEGFSLPVIAAALSYKKADHVAELERSPKTNHDKVTELLLSWKKEIESNKCTWSVLINFLRNLNSKELIEKVNNIRGERDQNDRAELKLEFEMESYTETVTFPEPTEVTAQQTGQAAMVTGAPLASNNTPMMSAELYILANKITVHQRNFTLLQTFLYTNLKTSGKVEEARIFISGRLQEPTANDKTLSPLYSEIIAQYTLSEVFQYLNIEGFWNFLNYYLIKELTDAFSDQSVKDKMVEYEAQMHKFMAETKLCDFLEVWKDGRDATPYLDMGKVVTKLKRKWESCTLQDVAKTQKALAGMFKLKKFLFNFLEGNNGSVELRWLVPQPYFKYMKRVIREMQGVKRLSETQDIYRIVYSELDRDRQVKGFAVIQKRARSSHASDPVACPTATKKQPSHRSVPPKAASLALKRIHSNSDSTCTGVLNGIDKEDLLDVHYSTELEGIVGSSTSI